MAAHLDSIKHPGLEKFKQQRLETWHPSFSPLPVILCYVVTGIAFVPIGVVMLLASNGVVEVTARYDDFCPDGQAGCRVTLDVPSTMQAPVYLYYKLDNFYQNHRRYVRSRNDAQLAGQPVTFSDVTDCAPLQSLDGNQRQDAASIFLPCGLIAGSVFNDTFALFSPSSQAVSLRKQGIAWSSDVETLFHNPPASVQGVRVVPDLEDEDFIVWMRNAGMSSFRKLHRIIDSELPPGNYTVEITNNYPVHSFSGQKWVVLSTTSFLGGKNPFLGYAFIIIGGLCFLLGVAFAIKHSVSPRKPGDLSYLDKK